MVSPSDGEKVSDKSPGLSNPLSIISTIMSSDFQNLVPSLISSLIHCYQLHSDGSHKELVLIRQEQSTDPSNVPMR
jgi:hypothetical protein